MLKMGHKGLFVFAFVFAFLQQNQNKTQSLDNIIALSVYAMSKSILSDSKIIMCERLLRKILRPPVSVLVGFHGTTPYENHSPTGILKLFSHHVYIHKI